MRVSPADLSRFWAAASEPVPIVIVGAGRWGRVWARVLAGARSGSAGITIVARSNAADTEDWIAATPVLQGMRRLSTLAEGFAGDAPTRIAIIASRPRDHVRDALEALSAGLHVMVEKPVSPDPDDASRLIAAAKRANRILGVGTEFAFHPDIQRLAELLGTGNGSAISASLTWTDPAGEVRHGARKAVHDEIDVLDDLLPHALSVFRVIRPTGEFRLTAIERRAGRGGALTLTDRQSSTYRLACDAESDGRRRILQVDHQGRSGNVDFAVHPAVLTIEGAVVAQPLESLAFDSTLRLEIGAIIAEVLGLCGPTAVTSGLVEMVALHAALRAQGPYGAS